MEFKALATLMSNKLRGIRGGTEELRTDCPELRVHQGPKQQTQKSLFLLIPDAMFALVPLGHTHGCIAKTCL